MQTDDIDHIKDILLKFIVNVPITTPGNEQMLQIVFSMLQVTKEESDFVNEKWDAITPHNRSKSWGVSEEKWDIKKRFFSNPFKK